MAVRQTPHHLRQSIGDSRTNRLGAILPRAAERQVNCADDGRRYETFMRALLPSESPSSMTRLCAWRAAGRILAAHFARALHQHHPLRK
jgi:hypothetical protein